MENSLKKRFSVDNMNISNVNIVRAVNLIEDVLKKNKTGYICVTNTRTCYLANHNSEYCEIQNNSLLTVPDGIPLVWIARILGHREVQKVSGHGLMDALFKESKEKGYSHYFYGCSQKTIDLLSSNLMKLYPGLDIRGAVSPPFQPLESFDINALSEQINTLRPTFFWCGLGAPKQEKLISLLQPQLNQTISIGVGLAFEYYAETVKRAPIIVQKFGMEWLFRISQQPIKGVRFVKPFFWMLQQILKAKFKINEV